LAGGGHVSLIAPGGERRAEGAGDGRFVVDDENELSVVDVMYLPRV
jgi:hypothetical protein